MDSDFKPLPKQLTRDEARNLLKELIAENKRKTKKDTDSLIFKLMQNSLPSKKVKE